MDREIVLIKKNLENLENKVDSLANELTELVNSLKPKSKKPKE